MNFKYQVSSIKYQVSSIKYQVSSIKKHKATPICFFCKNSEMI